MTKVWAMRRRDLSIKSRGPFDYATRIWRGEHPSPTFKGIKVWWASRHESELSNLLKKVYLDESLPSWNDL